MAYHVPFEHRNKKPGKQPPVYIGFDSPNSCYVPCSRANQRHYHQLHVAPRPPFNWSAFFGLMLALVSPFTLFLIAPIALLFSLRGLRRAPRGMAFVATIFSLGGTAILATVIFGIVASHHEENMAHQRAYEARILKQERAETSVTLDAAAKRLETYRSDNEGQLPSGLDGNVMTISFTDAWDTELRYEPGTKQAIIRSAGPDGHFSTGDDMVTTVKGEPKNKFALQ